MTTRERNVDRAGVFVPSNPGVSSWKRSISSSAERVLDVEGITIRITTCRSWQQLEQRIPEWEKILNENTAQSIFSTPEWLGSWWKAFGLNRQLCTLIFCNQAGELVGLAPLYVDNCRWAPFGRLKLLRLVGDGSGDSDNLDLIIQPGFEKVCARAFLQWLREQPDCNVCCLNTLPHTSAAALALMEAVKAANWPLLLIAEPNAVIHLPTTWQSYEKSLKPEFRPLVSRYPRRLEKRYQVRILRCEDASQLPAELDTLFSLHQRRWNSTNHPGSFSFSQRRKFYSQMAGAFLRRGWLELWFLELDGRVVAAQFCFRYRQTAYILQEGFDPNFASEKVGYALRAAMLRYFIESRVVRYDFLGGCDAHKQNWGSQLSSYLNLHFAPPTRFGRSFLACAKLANKSKRWLRDRIPSRVWMALHRLKTRVHGQSNT